MSAAISSGRPLRPRGDLNASISGPTVGMVEPLLQERGLDRAGRHRVQRDPRTRPVGGRRVTAHPPRECDLGDRIGAQRLALACKRARRRLVALQAAGDQRLVEPGLARRRVRADRHRRGVGAAGEERPEPGEQLDGAEVVDRDQQRRRPLRQTGQPGEGHEPVERATRELADARDGLGATLGGAEVGLHLGVLHVDADDPVAGGGQALGERGPHPRTGSRDRDGPHGFTNSLQGTSLSLTGSRGSPRARSPITLRCTSSVPPPIRLAHWLRN